MIQIQVAGTLKCVALTGGECGLPTVTSVSRGAGEGSAQRYARGAGKRGLSLPSRSLWRSAGAQVVRVFREVGSSPAGVQGSPGPDFGNPQVISKTYLGRSSKNFPGTSKKQQVALCRQGGRPGGLGSGQVGP